MRDIRPQPNKPRRFGPPMGDEPADLPAIARPAKPRFSGSSVPVSSVHVPKQHMPKKMVTAAKQMPPAVAAEFESEDKRPLFAPTPATKKPKKQVMRVGQKERLILASIFALLIVAVIIAGLIFLPHATIALTLQTSPLLVDQQLTLQANNSDDPSVLPASVFTREVKVDGAAPVTSKQVVGKKASGTVDIINRTSDEQKIKEHSRLVTKDGVLFYMQGHAFVPPNGSVSVAVEAAEAGPAGNITPQKLTFVALDASAKNLVYGQNSQTLTGGTGDTVSVVKDADIAAAKQAAGQSAQAQVEQDIRSQLPKGWLLLEESWNDEVKSFDTPAKVDAQQDSIPYTANVTVRVMSYQDDKFQAALKAALDAKLDKNYMLFPGPISYTKSLTATDWDKGEATLAVRVTHTTVPIFSLDTLRDKLAGLSQESAVSYLSGLTGVKSASVDLWPFWVHSIPTINKQINIDLKPDR